MEIEIEEKIWNKLSFYKKEKIRIRLTYSNITVSGIVIKMRSWFCETYIILNCDGTLHKIFVEDIKEGTVFPDNTIVEKHFINSSHDRKSIPKSVKSQIWKDRFGDRFQGRCDVCKNEIRRDYFEAGHIISANDGGEDTVDNLKPICRTCNRSMGTENLEQFKLRYHT